MNLEICSTEKRKGASLVRMMRPMLRRERLLHYFVIGFNQPSRRVVLKYPSNLPVLSEMVSSQLLPLPSSTPMLSIETSNVSVSPSTLNRGLGHCEFFVAVKETFLPSWRSLRASKSSSRDGPAVIWC